MEKVKNILQPTIWVEQYADRLFKFAVSRIGNVDDAKDLVQDTFLSALKNPDNFEGETSEKNWLFSILKNKIIDYYRSKVNRTISLLNGHQIETKDFFDKDGNWQQQARPQEWRIDYSARLETKEFYEILEKCKDKLSELQNAAFTMKYMDEFDHQKICKELGISPSNYWVVLHRAKLQLRQCLQDNYFKR